MHELGHGLGFVGSMDVSGGSGRCGSGTNIPFVYDPLVVNGSGQTLTAVASCPAASAGLASQLQGGNLYWNGANGVSAAGGARPRLYAPNPWQSGSSFSHLDEASYPAGNPNSLMTPAVGRAEVIHDPGPVALGMFRDMGWAASSGSGTAPAPTPTPAPTSGTPTITSPAPSSTLPGSTVTFQWSAGSGVQEYTLWVGSTVYVKLWWKGNGSWQSKDYTFTAG
jgi:hypothetical protein